VDRRLTSIRSIFGSSALALLLLGSVSARAATEDPEVTRQRAFREAYERAGQAYAAKDYAAAIPALQAAFAIEPVPQILFNIAQAHRKLEQWGAARAYFELYRAVSKDLAPEAATELNDTIVEMRGKERELLTPQSVEKTKLLYVQQEKPLPAWLRPTGLAAGLLGLGTLGAGAALLGIDGLCANSPTPPALECTQVYATGTAGKVLTGIGSVVLIGGIVMFSLSFKKPARPAVREAEAPRKNEELAPLLKPIAIPTSEPPPKGWNEDGTRAPQRY
jgi:hypothetical protein